MSRTTSAALKAALYAAECTDEFIVLLTLDHADLEEPIRVNSSGVDVVSRSNSFLAYPFNLTMPDDTGDRPSRAKLSIDNIDRVIVQTMRELTSAPSMLIEIVRAADLDTVEASFPDFLFVNISYDHLAVEGELTLEEFMNEPYPQGIFSPNYFPGLF